MKILFFGDIMGRAGRKAMCETLPRLRENWAIDFIVANGENTSSGLGLTPQHANELLEVVDVITLGDHAFDQRDMMRYIENEKRIIRPLNLGNPCPGRGAGVFEDEKGRKILVTQALGQVFMKQAYANPFVALDKQLKMHPLGGAVQAVIVDFHAEATSEKTAMGHYLDGRASLVVGTHTHIPTGDARILSQGTGYLTDAGMCGDYDSVIGMKKPEPIRRFVTGIPKERFQTADQAASLCGIYIETDDKTGACKKIVPIRIGDTLQNSTPS